MSAHPQPQQQPPPTKKKTSSLKVLFIVMGGLFALLVLVVGIGAYLVMSSPKGRMIVGVMGEAVKITAKAQKAPGTKELRALGFTQAMVMDITDLERLTASIDGGVKRTGPDFGEIAICSAGRTGTPPTCEAVASTYVKAVGPRSKTFMVTVQQQANKNGGCQAFFDPNGKLTESAPPIAAPALTDDGAEE